MLDSFFLDSILNLSNHHIYVFNHYINFFQNVFLHYISTFITTDSSIVIIHYNWHWKGKYLNTKKSILNTKEKNILIPM